MSMSRADFQHLMRLLLALVSLTGATAMLPALAIGVETVGLSSASFRVTLNGTLPRDGALQPARLGQFRRCWPALDNRTQNQAADPLARFRSERGVRATDTSKYSLS